MAEPPTQLKGIRPLPEPGPPGSGHVHGADCDHEHGGGHDHGGHDHGGHHHHGPSGPADRHTPKRLLVAGALVLLAVLAATFIQVQAGTAVVITRFGNPVRVVTDPGPAWRLPAPIEQTTVVDLRLHTTSSGIQALLTRDSLNVTMQAYLAWHVAGDEADIDQFVRSVRNSTDEAAAQLRTFLGSALQTVSGQYDFSRLVNTDASQVQLEGFQDAVKARLSDQVRQMYGITIEEVGVERLLLPDQTVSATIERMSSERAVVAEQRRASGKQKAQEIRSDADSKARITKASAEEQASQINAQARSEAAAIYGKVQAKDPQVYAFLRSLESLDQIITSSSVLVLRTDSAPFNALVTDPTTLVAPPKPGSAPASPQPSPPASPPAGGPATGTALVAPPAAAPGPASGGGLPPDER